MSSPDENATAANDGLRHLARNADDERVRFRACEYLLGIPQVVYAEGFVDAADLPSNAIPVVGQSPEDAVLQMSGADL